MSGAKGTAGGPRPRQVTLGGLLALTGCVLLVFSMLDSMARVRSVEMRESVERVLTTPPGDGLGISIETVLGLLRGTVLLTGGLAAAGAVLAGYTLVRHRGARIGLSVTAVLMLFTATFVSGLLPVVVAIGATMLWSRDARDWFAGRAARPNPHDASARAGLPGPGSRSGGGTADRSADRPSPGLEAWAPPRTDVPAPAAGGRPVLAAPAGPAAVRRPRSLPGLRLAPGPAGPAGSAQGQQGFQGYPPPYGYGPPPGRPPGSRPVQVTIAAWLTWVFSLLTLLFFGLLIGTLLADRDQLLAELQRNPRIAAAGWDSQRLLGALWVVGAVGIAWCLAASALAVLAYRRVRLGRIGLAVSCVFALVLGVLFVVGVVHALAAVVTVVLLFVGASNRWYDGQDTPHPFGPGSGSYGPPSGPPYQPPTYVPPEQKPGKPPLW